MPKKNSEFESILDTFCEFAEQSDQTDLYARDLYNEFLKKRHIELDIEPIHDLRYLLIHNENKHFTSQAKTRLLNALMKFEVKKETLATELLYKDIHYKPRDKSLERYTLQHILFDILLGQSISNDELAAKDVACYLKAIAKFGYDWGDLSDLTIVWENSPDLKSAKDFAIRLIDKYISQADIHALTDIMNSLSDMRILRDEIESANLLGPMTTAIQAQLSQANLHQYIDIIAFLFELEFVISSTSIAMLYEPLLKQLILFNDIELFDYADLLYYMSELKFNFRDLQSIKFTENNSPHAHLAERFLSEIKNLLPEFLPQNLCPDSKRINNSTRDRFSNNVFFMSRLFQALGNLEAPLSALQAYGLDELYANFIQESFRFITYRSIKQILVGLVNLGVTQEWLNAMNLRMTLLYSVQNNFRFLNTNHAVAVLWALAKLDYTIKDLDELKLTTSYVDLINKFSQKMHLRTFWFF